MKYKKRYKIIGSLVYCALNVHKCFTMIQSIVLEFLKPWNFIFFFKDIFIDKVMTFTDVLCNN